MADIGEAKKRASIRVAVVLKRLMGADDAEEGNLKKDMFTVSKEELPDNVTKQGFKTDIEALGNKLRALGINPQLVPDPIRVVS